MLMPGHQVSLPIISRIVDMLNMGYKKYLEAEVQALVSHRAPEKKHNYYLNWLYNIYLQNPMFYHLLESFRRLSNIGFGDGIGI